MNRTLLLTVLALTLPACGSFKPLFNGRDLEGWTVNENPASFSVKDGLLVAHGERSHLFYTGPVQNHDFTDFHLKATVKTEPGANSGIYFHTAQQPSGWPTTGFEAQVNNTHTDPKKTGGLYAVQDVMNDSPAKDGEWFDYDIIVKDMTVTIKINGQVTSTWTQPADWQPPQNMPGRKIDHGTIAIQGHDPKSVVYYKEIRIKALR